MLGILKHLVYNKRTQQTGSIHKSASDRITRWMERCRHKVLTSLPRYLGRGGILGFLGLFGTSAVNMQDQEHATRVRESAPMQVLQIPCGKAT